MSEPEMSFQAAPDPSSPAGEPPAAKPRPFGVIPGLIWGFRMLDDGTAVALPVDQPVDQPVGHDHRGWLWLHLDLADARAARWLAKVDLPEAAVASMLSRDEHQQLHTAGSVVYGVLADLLRDINNVGDDLATLHFVMTDRLMLTGRRHSLAAVQATRDAIEAGAARLPHCAALFELIVEHLADGIDDVDDDLADKLDEIEDHLARRSIGPARRSLSDVRRTSVRLHRHLWGLRAVLSRVERRGMEDLDPRLQLRAGRLVQRLDELDHCIVETRERGRRLQEEVSTTIAEDTNRHLHVLSVLTALLLPPALVAGVFGMNTKNLPLTDEDGGSAWALILVFGSSLAAYLVLRLTGVLKRGD